MTTRTTTAAMATLQATSNTHKAHNAIFRQHQLKSLHDSLRTQTPNIISAIRNNSNVSLGEATVECALVLSIIKEHYEAINPAKELAEEHQTSRSENAASREQPWNLVYIEPDLRHTTFFSVTVAVSTAVAAGNCVALKLENPLRQLLFLLKELLSQALSADTFTIVSSKPDYDFLNSCQQVLQTIPTQHPSSSHLASSHGYVVAIVDRTANLRHAARDLVTASFAFGGTSPYAPDLVLVNEFIMKDFQDLVLQYSIPFVTRPSSSSENRRLPTTETLSQDKNWSTRIITSGISSAVIELQNPSPKHITLPAKRSVSVFTITAITSLDHAIDLISNSNGLANSPCLAAYHFAAPAHAKYLSQFISSEISFINHIPSRLLLGPAAPSYQPFDLLTRYTTAHFRRRMPVFCTSGKTTDISALTEREEKAIMHEAVGEIREVKRPEWIAHGFFEQGIFIGLGVYGVPILACIGTGVVYGIRLGIKYSSSFG